MHEAESKAHTFQTMLVLLEDSLLSEPFFIHLMSHWMYYAHIFIFFPFIKILTC